MLDYDVNYNPLHLKMLVLTMAHTNLVMYDISDKDTGGPTSKVVGLSS